LKNSDSKVESKYALDATAFYQGFHLHTMDTCLTTGLVFDEISHIQYKTSSLDVLMLAKRIVIHEPIASTATLVKLVAKRMGESRLSEADVSILALAKDYNAVLVSDDFAISNLAKSLSIELLNLGTKGIRERRKWIKYCGICGKGYSPTQSVCSLCGNKLRVRYKKLKGKNLA
jgi:endoribonuclease Nob1